VKTKRASGKMVRIAFYTLTAMVTVLILIVLAQASQIRDLTCKILILNSALSMREQKERMIEEKKRKILIGWIKNRASAKVMDGEVEKIVNHTLKTDYPILIISLIKAESSFYKKAVSKTGAMGLGQIFWSHHGSALKKIGLRSKKELFEIEKAVKATDLIFKDCLYRAKGNWVVALQLYRGKRDYPYMVDVFKNFVEINILLRGITRNASI
jgi:hypothetical protein